MIIQVLEEEEEEEEVGLYLTKSLDACLPWTLRNGVYNRWCSNDL